MLALPIDMNLQSHFQKGSVHISVFYLRLELNNVYIKKVRGIVSLYTVLSTRGWDYLRNQKNMYNISILTYKMYTRFFKIQYCACYSSRQHQQYSAEEIVLM